MSYTVQYFNQSNRNFWKQMRMEFYGWRVQSSFSGLHSFLMSVVCVFSVRFNSSFGGGVFNCSATPASGCTTQLQLPRWSSPTCSLQTLSWTRYPREIWQPIKPPFLQNWQSILSSASPAATSPPRLSAWKATEATLLRTPQAMYVREPYFVILELRKPPHLRNYKLSQFTCSHFIITVLSSSYVFSWRLKLSPVFMAVVYHNLFD